MKKWINFFKNTILGGFIVLLPTGIMVFAGKFIFDIIYGFVNPIAKRISSTSNLTDGLSVIVTIASILLICFIIGITTKTGVGKWLHLIIESNLLRKIPGYKIVRETVKQVFENEQAPFSKVALAEVYAKGVYSTCFVTDESGDLLTVFVPTGPNPTSGNIFHVSRERVVFVETNVEDAMKSIIGCGIGSKVLLKGAKLNK